MPDAANAINLLTNDHRVVEALFEKFDRARSIDRKAEIVSEICEELAIHMTVEEEIFYPRISEAVEEDLLDEAYVEHDGAKKLIRELKEAEPSDAFFDAKVAVLKEMIEHHVHEEERQRDSMFAQTRKAKIDLEALGTEMASRKKELQALAKTGALSIPPNMTQ